MSETPPVSSWVDLGTSPVVSRRTTPVPFGSNSDYMRMLREAQSETSCRTSAKVSPITSAFMSQSSTCRNSPTPGSCTPRSPPPSPCPEVECLQDDLASGIFINRMREPETSTAISEFMWDWSSRTQPPTKWRGSVSSNKTGTSNTKEPRKYSRRAFFSLLLSNLISLVIGAGLGVWIYRRNSARTLDIFLDWKTVVRLCGWLWVDRRDSIVAWLQSGCSSEFHLTIWNWSLDYFQLIYSHFLLNSVNVDGILIIEGMFCWKWAVWILCLYDISHV